MKNILTFLLVSGVLFLASCGNGANDPLPVIPPADSATNASYLNIWFQSNDFWMKDLKLNGISSVAVTGSDVYNATDSFWEVRLRVIDAPKDQMELNITAHGPAPTGDFTVVDNSSTLIDYSHGENKTYAISIGSVVSVSSAAYPLKGTMQLTLYYNHETTYANDSFQVN